MESKKEIQAELAAIAPLLNTLSKEPIQRVPDRYFTAFSVNLPKEQGKLVKMPAFRRMLQYATAAVVAGVLVVGGYVYTSNSGSSFDFDHYSKLDVATAINTVSDDELQQYLNSATAIAGADNTLQSFETEEPGDPVLENISDDDLLNYLQEEGTPLSVKKSS